MQLFGNNVFNNSRILLPGLGHVSVSLIFWETINVLPGPSFSRKISDNGIFLRGFEVSGEISLVPENSIEVSVLV